MARKDSLKALKDILVLRRDALRKALKGDLSMLKELRAQGSGDAADFAIGSTQDEISSQLAQVESRELTHIDGALERMREGTYGQCAFCDTNIPLARLQALPYAMSCIQCQRELEKRGVDVNSPVDWESLTRDGISESFMET